VCCDRREGLRVAMQHNNTLQNGVPKRAKEAAPGRGTKHPSHAPHQRHLSNFAADGIANQVQRLSS
jgi:hypothetical protein